MSKPYSKRWRWLALIIVLALVGLYLRPLPKITPTSQLPTTPKAQVVGLPWPAIGQSALGAEGYGLLARHGDNTPVPIGSTAKIFTALAVLKQKPIAAGSQGPSLTLNQADVDLFNSYYSQNGSVTNVAAGEKITELQALQSLLLPSSNNMADTLANWAFGSKDAYLKYANGMVKSMGLRHTTVGDTNGFSDSTTSTADDLVTVGLAALKNPVFADVVSQSTAQIPVEGTINNTNFLLGSDGVVGIKTGHTDKAGGNYVFAARNMVQGHQVTLVGAVLSQPAITDAIHAAPSLIQDGDAGFKLITVVHKNQTLGFYTAPWGQKAEIRSPKDLSLLIWDGASTKITTRLNDIGPAPTGTAVGEVTVSNLGQSAKSGLVLSGNLAAPSPLWRFIR